VQVVSDDASEQAVKMSKSLGNIVEPGAIIAKYGADALRYFLMREIPYWGDGSYSERNLATRYNNDLGNDLGNLVLRTLSMIERYFDGKVPRGAQGDVVDWPAADKELHAVAEETLENVPALMDAFDFSGALEGIWGLVRAANRYVEENRPWTLAKEPDRRERLGVVLYNLAEACRLLSWWVAPFMPATAGRIRQQLALDDRDRTILEAAKWGRLPGETHIRKGDPLFPRLDLPGEDDTKEKNT
jgi:methionyl-tRNA synthetase